MSSLRLVLFGELLSRLEKFENELSNNQLYEVNVLITNSHFDAEQLLNQTEVDAFISVENDDESSVAFLNELCIKYPNLSFFVLVNENGSKPYNKEIVQISKKSFSLELFLNLVEREVENKRLHEDLKRLKQNVIVNEKRARAINDVYTFKTTSEQELLDFALQKAMELTESDFGYIYKYSEEKEQFTLNSWSKGVMKECEVVNPQTCYELGKTGFWGEAVRQRKAIILNDFGAKNPLKKGYPEGHVPLSRFMTAPVFDKDEIIAVVGVANKVEPYHNGDVVQLQLLLNSVWNLLKTRLNTAHISQLTKAIESTKASIVITNQLGTIEYANPYFFEHTGYAEHEALGANPRVLKSGYHSREFYEQMWQTLTSGQTWEGELRNKKKNGDIYWESAVISPITNLNGVISHFVAVKTDITQQKLDFQKLQKSQRDLKVFVENSGLPMMVYSPKGDVLLLNQAAARNMGGVISDFVGKNILELFPDDGEIYLDRLSKSLASTEELVFEDFVFNKFWFRSRYQPVYLDSGDLMGIQIISEDITTLKESLIENDKQSIIINHALSIAKVYPWTFDIATEKFTFHKKSEQFFEEPLPDAFSKDFLYNKFYDADKTWVIEAFENSWNKDGFELEHRYLINGKIKWVRVKGNVNLESSMLIGVMQDITAEKNMLLQIEESEKLKASVIDALSEGIVVQDESDKIILANNSAAEVLGLSMDQLIGKSSFDPLWQAIDENNIPLKPEEHPSVVARSTGIPINGFIMKVHTGNNDERIISINSRPIKDQSGNIIQSVTTFADISKEREASNAIRKSEEKYRRLTESLTEIVWKADAEGNITYINVPGLKILGKDFETLKNSGWLSIIHKDDVDFVAKKWMHAVNTKTEYINQQRMMVANGTYHWFKLTAKPQVDENNKITEWVGLSLDINREKIVAEKVLELKERYKVATYVTSDAIWDWKVNSNVITWNSTFAKIFRNENEANTYKKWINLVHPTDRDDVKDQLVRPLNDDFTEESHLEFRMRKHDNAYAFVECNAKFLRDDKGKVERVIGSLKNITSEKLRMLEKELKYAITNAITNETILERQLRATGGVLGSFLKCEVAEAWLVSLDNKQLKRKASYIKDETYREIVKMSRAKKSLNNGEGLNVKAWNSKVLEVVQLDDTESKASFVRNEIASSKGLNTALALPIVQNEQVVAVYVLISKQKEENFRIFYPLLQNISTDLGGEIQRLRSESERKLFFELSLDLLCIASTDGYFKKINPAFTSVLGYSEQQILDIPFIDFVINEDVERTKKFAQDLIDSPGKTLYFENRYLRKDNTKVWLAWTAVYIDSEDLIFATAKDFTERMVYTRAIESQNKRLKEIAWTQSHILRAPLVNIMGLVNLLEMGVEQGMNLERILIAMKDSTAAFDDVVKDITRKSEVLYKELETKEDSRNSKQIKPSSVQ